MALINFAGIIFEEHIFIDNILNNFCVYVFKYFRNIFIQEKRARG